jgi:hypothetical protein
MSWKFATLGVALALSTMRAVMLTPLRAFIIQQGVGLEHYQSDKFVPFVSDLVDTRQDSVIRGRFYRAADGSERTEQLEGASHVILIKNIPEKRYDTCRLLESDCFHAGQWLSQPMTLPPGPYKPGRWLRTDREEQRVGAWRCVVYRSSDGRHATYEADDLDYFPIRLERGDGGVTEFLNITRTEPDQALFRPPAGATVKVSQIPGGIITTPYQPQDAR